MEKYRDEAGSIEAGLKSKKAGNFPGSRSGVLFRNNNPIYLIQIFN